jgi:ribonuclease R
VSDGREDAAGSVPAGAFVAVLERRGRFLTAQPVFAPRDSDAGRGRESRTSAPVVAGPSRSRGQESMRASAGDLVLVRQERAKRGARVVRVLGRPDVAADAIEGLLLDRGLARGFPAAVEQEASAAAARVRSQHRDARDLRDLATFTIDPASARDFDDAISAQRMTGGGVRVWIHIADVAAHVPEGGVVDREARTRATSIYAPGTVEPMLPHALSSDACSLVAGQDRAAVTVELELELEGAAITRAAFYRSLIRSDARLDYEQVDRIFARKESAAEPWGDPLGAAREAAAALGEDRRRSTPRSRSLRSTPTAT